jgi:NADP-dependent 3-hydroxy acid dehydrogenase YdfG
MRDLTGKVAWITGAGTGMGRAGALSLAEAGMKVALSGRRVDKLEEVAEIIGADAALVVPLDVTDQPAVVAAAREIEAGLGDVDVLVNSAGTNTPKRFWRDEAIAEFDQVMAINLNGAFYCCQAVLAGMRSRGDGLIINISSWAGRYHALVSGPAYNASKAGMIWMNENLNIEDGENGIRACSINPGEVATEILDKRPISTPQEERDKMVQPEEIGEIIRFITALPAHVCINDLTVSPTWNRAYVGTVPKP